MLTPLGFRMNPVDLIKRELGPVEWERCRQAWAEESIINFRTELNIFRDYKIYVVRGQTQQFDFPMLPRCSYGYYAANGREAVRLTRTGKEIERILAAEWSSLPAQDPVKLASFVIGFYDGGIAATHRVLANAYDLRDMAAQPRKYHINESALARALPAIGETSCKVEGDAVRLRAITLRGWMHRKGNLGIETIVIAKDGGVNLGPRDVLAENIFDKVPSIRY
jgi:hypothetical protein